MDAATMTALDPAKQGPLTNEPSAIEMLRQNLAEKHLPLLSRRDQLLDAVKRVPAEIENEETAGRVADFIKQLTGAHKNAETARVAEKEPHLEAGRAVDGWFKTITDPLAGAKKVIETRLTLFQRKKADEQRRQREEEERLLREVAKKALEAAAAREAEMKTEADVAAAIAAADAAEQAAKDQFEAAKAANASAAELSRTRGDFGGVASLRTVWTGDLVDRATLDLEALRSHIPTDALERAIRSFVKAGGRQLRGATIYESMNTVVR